MPRPQTNLHQKVRDILGHSLPLPPEASSPIRHFERTANATMSMLKYVDDHLDAAGFYGTVKERHIANLRRMALASLVESFERFLKELAILCIDSLADFVNDDRFDEFSAKGGQIAFHLSAGSVGKALCESDTWLTNRTTNERFRKLLKRPFGDNWENLFRKRTNHLQVRGTVQEHSRSFGKSVIRLVTTSASSPVRMRRSSR